MILDKIYSHKLKEVAEDKGRVSVETLKESCKVSSQTGIFRKALKRNNELRVIAEVKKASPSAGIIREDFDYVAIAREYESSGAAAISVLTDKEFFKGDLKYLAEIKGGVKIPLLRKDFIIDPYQIYEAGAAGADAILLIARLLTKEQIDSFLAISRNLGMECLVEIHDRAELDKILETESEIIGINNRDLHTFQTDLNTTLRLCPLIPGEKVIVSESGIKTRADVRRLENAGVDAILIGETLMRSSNISSKMKELLGD